MPTLESIQYSKTDRSLKVIDQLKLPHEKEYIAVTNADDAWSVIRNMQVRGAPLIAITAALGLAVEANSSSQLFASAKEATEFLLERMKYLRTSRPTAVNLFVATDELSALVTKLGAVKKTTPTAVLDGFIAAAEQMLEDDIATNKAIGDHGAKRILELVPSHKRKDPTGRKIRVLTICNTGSLATAGYGTALGVIRSLHAMGKLDHVYACETRPYNQGARLTAFEIVEDGLPGTLIADSMASALLAVKGIDCVVVGADRVTSNGDTANKIGTYQLAIAAKHHGVPFFAAVPTTTLDLTMRSGSEILVEERPAAELTSIFGQKIAPDGIGAWNPAFDVTPCSLIRGIITELGVIESKGSTSAAGSAAEAMVGATSVYTTPSPTSLSASVAIESEEGKEDGYIDVAGFLKTLASNNPALMARVEAAEKVLLQNKTKKGKDNGESSSYTRMDESKIVPYLCSVPRVRDLLFPAGAEGGKGVDYEAVDVREIGDGNLNYVYIVQRKDASGSTAAAGGEILIAKQALPYIRCVGESWPMTLERAYFESSALEVQRTLTLSGSGIDAEEEEGAQVPEVYHFDRENALIVMRYVEPPHLILRKALIQGLKVHSFASDLGIFIAKTLFGTSVLALEGGAVRRNVSEWSRNNAMCALTEKVIFTDPYTVDNPMNRWTSPYLDIYATSIAATDAPLKLAAAALKTKFLTQTQALLHGDLHTGSVMVKPGLSATERGSTFVIDPEFAFYGPMGFDLGAILSNLFLAYFSQYSHKYTEKGTERAEVYANWILEQTVVLYDTFSAQFLKLWNAAIAAGGDTFPGEAYKTSVFGRDSKELRLVQSAFMAQLWKDALGFAGVKMIRRIVGISHVEDMECIADAEIRSICEKKALIFARSLVLASSDDDVVGGLRDIREVALVRAKQVYETDPSVEWPTSSRSSTA